MKVKRFVNYRDFSCNVFVCSGDKGNFIVDLGYFDSEIEEYLKSLSSIDFVLQTHGHFDHIIGLNSFSKLYPDVPVYIMDEEIDVAKTPALNGSNLMMYQQFIPEVTFTALKEGNCRIKNYSLQVLHTPGHTKGSCMFLFKDENVLFTGDTIIETSIGRTDLPTGNEDALFRSLKKFKKIEMQDSVEVYSGHGEMLTYKMLMKKNPFLFD